MVSMRLVLSLSRLVVTVVTGGLVSRYRVATQQAINPLQLRLPWEVMVVQVATADL